MMKRPNHDHLSFSFSGNTYSVVRVLVDHPARSSYHVQAGDQHFHLRHLQGVAEKQLHERLARLRETQTSPRHVLPSEVALDEENTYVLRPWVDQEPFELFVRRFRFAPKRLAEALNIGVQLCRAVEGLHHRSLAHGALKNSNVFLEKDRTPVVVDAALCMESSMALQDDVRSLGLLLCRILARDPDLEVSDRILMRLYKARVPKHLLRVLWQAIHDDPAMRFPDAATLGRALREVSLPEYKRTVDVRPLPEGAVPNGVAPAIRNTALFVCGVGVVALGSWIFRDGNGSATPFEIERNTSIVRTDAPTGVEVVDLRSGSGAALEQGDYARLRFLTQRVALDDHLYKDWSGEAEVAFVLSSEGPQVTAVWRSLLGMREGGVRRIVIGPPESDELTGILNGEAYELPAGTIWTYEVEALSTLPEPRSRIGIAIDTESTIVGALVTQVVGEPARRAGLAPDDLIKEVDGESVGSGEHAMRLLRRLEPHVPVTLTVSRAGAQLQLTITPEEAPDRTDRSLAAEAGALWIGGEVILPSAVP